MGPSAQARNSVSIPAPLLCREPSLHLVLAVAVDVAVIALDVPGASLPVHVGGHQRASCLGTPSAQWKALVEILSAPFDGGSPAPSRVQHPDNAVGVGPADAEGVHDLLDAHDHRLRIAPYLPPSCSMNRTGTFCNSVTLTERKMFGQDKLRRTFCSLVSWGNDLRRR